MKASRLFSRLGHNHWLRQIYQQKTKGLSSYVPKHKCGHIERPLIRCGLSKNRGRREYIQYRFKGVLDGLGCQQATVLLQEKES